MPGLFETIRVRAGRVPFLDRHIARLTASCQALGKEPPATGLVERVMTHAQAGDIIVRLTLEDRGERVETRAVPPPQPMRIVFSGTRHERYIHKSTDRAVFDRARARVVPYRADESVLLTEDGHLAEGCVTNVFFWLGGELCTPSLDLGILPGVGRARVIEIARAKGVTLREGRFTRAEIQGLPFFLVNAVRGVLETTVHGERHTQKDDRTAWLAERFWG